MFAVIIKNSILVFLIILIFHLIIKNHLIDLELKNSNSIPIIKNINNKENILKIEKNQNKDKKIKKVIKDSIIENTPVVKEIDNSNKILEDNNLIVTIEAGAINCWFKYLKKSDLAIGINKFGKSAPYKEIYEEMNLTSNKIASIIQKKLMN